ncbi:MAG: sulfatase-like hydrolase/transferase [Planctomycetes bacterium]|nr:sulfatase-like hydrolase/transferase [Planctomycetota bacterium]
MDRPNILMIYSDQHRYDCVGANGHPLLQTPSMNRLAAEGANFTHAFTPIPICVPARCSILTGQWPTKHGVIFNFDGETFRPLDPAIPTFSAAIQARGYRTVHIGRWHVDRRRTPIEFGFHDYVPDWRYGKWREARGLKPCPHNQGWRGQTDPFVRPEESSLGWGADQVIRWIELCLQETDPFFIRWHMAEPHLPCRPAEPFASMYPPERIAPWPGFADTLEGKPRIQRQMRATWGVEGMGWEEWAPIVSRYLGVVSQLDSQIGRVLDALKRLGLCEKTLVVYSSDHGDMCGSHGMVDKHYIMYDDVVRVPLIMRWAGVLPAGRTVTDFTSNAIDLPSTFCDAAGAATPQSFQGTSLLGAAAGTGATGREDIFASYHGNQFGSYSQRMVRDRRYKYVWNATALDEFYDLEEDPGEIINRISAPDCRAEIARLRKRLVAWMEATGDTLLNSMTRTQLEEGRIV